MDDTLQNVIQSTFKYDQFNLLANNRAVDENHVRRLKKAFAENPQTAAAQPILVNQRFEVIDGQHRLEACKELSLPVYFIVVPNVTIEDTRKLNVNQKSWIVRDFVRSYADSGDKSYQRYDELVDTYSFAHAVLLEACGLRHNKTVTSPLKLLKSGELKLTKADFEKSQKKLDKLSELVDIVNLLGLKVYSIAILRIMDSGEYKHSRMKSKLSMYGHDLQQTESLRDAGRNLEDVYNRRQRLDIARFSVTNTQ